MLLFGISVFSHSPEFQVFPADLFPAEFSPQWARNLLLFHKHLHSYSQNGRGDTRCFDYEKASSSKRMKTASFMHLGNEKARWAAAACGSPLLGRTRGHSQIRTPLPQRSCLVPPLARYMYFALRFPKRRAPSTLFSHLAAPPQQNSKSPSLLLCYRKLKISTPLELLLH